MRVNCITLLKRKPFKEIDTHVAAREGVFFMTSDSLSPRASLRLGGVPRLGDDRIRLLDAIGRTGSITLAAQELGLSYRAAWDAVQTLNNLFQRPLVRASPGGRSGGSAGLTLEGNAALATLRHVQAEIALTMARLGQRLAADHLGPAGLDPWRLVLRTSARNVLRGVVAAVVEGAVESAIVLKIDEGLEIRSVISRRSARDLGLSPGVEALALIKASLVRVAMGDGPGARGDDNVLFGTVMALETDAGVSEVVLELTEGKTLTATLTDEESAVLDLKVGDMATAFIKASHVILAID